MASREIKVKGKATRVRGATWTHDQVVKLFDVWTQPSIYKGLRNEKKKQGIFKTMAATLTNMGVHRTWTECRAKIKNLKADFRKSMDKKTQFRYYDQMWKIMNLDGSANDGGGGSTPGSGFTTSTSYPATPAAISDLEDDLHHDYGDQPSVRIDQSGQNTKDSLVDARPSTSAQYRTHSTNEVYEALAQHSFPTHATDVRQSYDDYQHGYGYRRHQRTPTKVGIYQNQREYEPEFEDPDSNSRSSMVITHVVSNVIEPVTTVVMPSTGGAYKRTVSPPASPPIHSPIPENQQPIRLEFILDNDNDNVILQQPTPPSSSTTTEFYPHQRSSSVIIPGPSVTPKRPGSSPKKTRPGGEASSTVTTTIPTSKVSSTNVASTSTSIVRNIPEKQNLRLKSPFSKLPIKPKFREKRPMNQSSKRNKVSQDGDRGKKRKMLETLNKKTVETISNLLTETSQSLLKELQEAEQRFILWEEDKRNEERKREEVMFTKLIAAIYSSASSGKLSKSSDDIDKEDEETESSVISNFKSVSKKLNDMVHDEIKATEDTLRQWESKMQRQESRHTEKLFAMIINAIKTPSIDVNDY